MRFELSRKEIRAFYLVIIGLDLFFILANSPFLFTPLDQTVAQPTSVVDFIKYQLDLKREAVLATWYSGSLLFVTGMIAVLISRARGAATQGKAYRIGWSLAGLLFIGISADEVCQFHEHAVALYKLIWPEAAASRGPGDWIPVLLPLAVIVTVGLVLFSALVLSADKRSQVLALVAIGCWIGAILAESFEGGLSSASGSRALQGFIEESVEIIGTTLFCVSFLEFLKKQQRGDLAFPPTHEA